MTHLSRCSKRSFIAVIQLVAFLPACTSWEVQPVSPAELVATQNPAQVRITPAGGSDVELTRVTIRGDTLYGVLVRDSAEANARPVGFALTEVEKVAIRQYNPGRTALFVVGLGVTVLSTLCLADALGCDPDYNTSAEGPLSELGLPD
jgi:hypothetical protein